MTPKTHKFGLGAYEFLTLTETSFSATAETYESLTIDGIYDLFCGSGVAHRIKISGFSEEKYVVENGEMYDTYLGATPERWVAQMVEFVIEDIDYYDPCEPHSDVEGECVDECENSYHTKEFGYPPAR